MNIPAIKPIEEEFCATDTGSIRQCVSASLKDYFEHMEDYPTTGLYDLVLAEVEQPLLESVLEHCRGNQTKAAQLLGINRGTLRKKLKQHGFICE